MWKAIGVAVVMLLMVTSAQAASLGVNFTGGGPNVTSDGAPGYVCTAWNNVSGFGSSASGLQDDASNGSVSYAWAVTGTSWWEGSWEPAGKVMTGKQKNHYVDQAYSLSNISSLGYSSYDFLAYGSSGGTVNGVAETAVVTDGDYSYAIWTGLTADNLSIVLNQADTAGLQIYAVPEPATMSLLVLGGVALLRRRNRR